MGYDWLEVLLITKNQPISIGDYRIDGYSSGQWFHESNKTLSDDKVDNILEMFQRTLTLNVEDGSVSGHHGMRDRLGFICQGSGSTTKEKCDGEDKQIPGNILFYMGTSTNLKTKNNALPSSF